MANGRRQGGAGEDPLAQSAETVEANSPARPPHRDPESIGPYRVIEKIGEGGMGVVYRAEQREPVRRVVALKVIKLGMDTKEVVARFEAERQALALMNHPNVAKVFDAGMTEQGRPYFAMEFVAGVPLTQYADEAKLTTRQRLELFVHVCHAVQHAHQKGIIHRDLKPSNILVTLFDGEPVPKVIDFGIAKATNAALTQHTLYTRTGALVGTPEYMSPEQALTSGLDVDTRTDIYSLGVILYELLTGTLPFDAEALRRAGPEGMARIIKDTEPRKPSTRLLELRSRPGTAPESGGPAPAPAAPATGAEDVARRRRTDPRSLLREISGDLDWVVLKAIEKERTRRYETANALAMDVQRHLHDEPVLARPPSTVYRLGKLARKYRTAVAAAAAVAAALVVAVAGTTVGLVRARAALHRAEAAERRAGGEAAAAQAARAAAERDARRATAANQFMRDMFSAGRPGAGANGGAEAGAAGKEDRGQVKVVDVLDSAAEALDRLKDQPELELDGRLTLADTYHSLELFPKAIEQYNRALALARQTYGEESEQALQVMADVAGVTAKADVGAATPLARQAAEAAARKLGPRHAVTLDARNSLGIALLHAGSYEEAERLFRPLVRDVRDLGPAASPKGSARFFNNLALAVSAQGRVTEAEELQREGLKLARKETTPTADRRVVLTQNLAVSLAKQNKLAEAEAALRDALDQSRQTVGPAHPQTIVVRALLARLLEQRGNFDAALALRREQAALFRGAKDDGTALDLRFMIAELLLRTGREAEAADAFASTMADERAASSRFPAYEDITRGWWARANLLLGLRIDRTWAGPALQGFATSAAWSTLRRHAWGDLSLGQADWPAARFRLEPWPPGNGRAAAEGALGDLRATPDPPPGVYLLSLSIPRKQNAPMRAATWVYVTPWKLSLFLTDDTASSWDDARWQKLFAGEPAERRNESALAFTYLSLLGRGYGPLGLADGYALSATTTARLPAGKYSFRVVTPGGARAFIDGQQVLNCWGQTSGTAEMTAPENDPGNELKIIAPAPERQFVVTLQPLAPEADRMVRAASGTDEVEADVDRLAEQSSKDPGNAQLVQDRGYALARAGRFREATSDLARAIEMRPAEHWAWYFDACVLAQFGDEAAYRKRCAGMLQRFRDAQQPEILERTGKACLLMPGAADPAACSELVGRAVDAGGTYLPFFQMAKGMAEYRRGRHADALEWFDKARQGLASTASTVRATDDYFRAMALFRLDRRAEARQALAEAEGAVTDLGFTPGIDDFGFSGLENFLICSVARREAKTTVTGGQPTKQP